MKKEYSAPEIEIYKYSEMDVITTSGEPGQGWNPNGKVQNDPFA